jgi:hypothetical protein
LTTASQHHDTRWKVSPSKPLDLCMKRLTVFHAIHGCVSGNTCHAGHPVQDWNFESPVVRVLVLAHPVFFVFDRLRLLFDQMKENRGLLAPILLERSGIPSRHDVGEIAPATGRDEFAQLRAMDQEAPLRSGTFDPCRFDPSFLDPPSNCEGGPSG